MKTSRYITGLVVLGAMLLLATGCNGSGTGGGGTLPPGLTKSLTLTPFANCGDLEIEVKEMLIGEMERNIDGYKYWCRYEGGGSPGEPVLEGSDDAATQSSAAETTKTNLQEAGVDEADLIKTDGTHAYAIVGDEVKVIQVWPFASFGLVATIKPEAKPKGIYLVDGRLIVLSVDEEDPAPIMEMAYWNPATVEATTIEEVYDISNPASPALTKRFRHEGRLLDSRRIDSMLYLVITGRGVVTPDIDDNLDIPYESLPPCSDSGEPEPNDALLAAIDNLKNKNRALIQSRTLAEIMPDVGDGKDIGCTEIMRCSAATGTQLLKVVSDAFDNESGTGTTSAILSNAGSVYASKDALYVSTDTMVYGWWLYADYDFEETTVIHRFALGGGIPAYAGSGEVAGHLVDNSYVGARNSARFSMAQFAMSEYDGYLRMATTVGLVSRGVSESDSRVTVLDIDNLEKVGEVTGLGRGERIYAVRFIGPRGYVVTFKKVDPLYVLDLSTPAAPTVDGELKIPGFSTYLHPAGEGRLIGLGFGGDDEGSFSWTQGLKLGLFDVSDPTNPFEVGNRELGSRGSYSAAVEEHHAFTLDRERGMIALPVEIYEGGSGSVMGSFAYSGVLLLQVDDSGSFATIGKIEMKNPSGSDVPSWWSYESTDILRTVIIGDGSDEGVITLARYGVQLNRIDGTMSKVGLVY